jgi:F-type H+-transporting ATPase subunit delta
VISGAVASRYAKAIFELAVESGNPDGLVDEISRAAEAYNASAELRGALDNPLVSYEAKKAILGDVAQALGLSVIAKHALFLLNDRRRLRALPDIAQRLREMIDLKKGVLRAEVVSAAPLGEGYLARLQQQLEKMTGKKVVLDKREDPSLIAGVVTRIGDTVYDGSLRARLNQLKHSLLPS